MRIAFFGTPEFAVPSLESIFHSRHRIEFVVTRPDKPAGRGLRLKPSPVKKKALELGLEVIELEKLRGSGLERRIKGLSTVEKGDSYSCGETSEPLDACVLVAYGAIVPSIMLEATPHGFINLHPSLLPKYRGASPIQQAILHGDSETGVTTMYLSMKLDAGDIIYQEKVPLDSRITAGELHDILAAVGARLLVKTLDDIEKSIAPRIPQDESQASYFPELKKEDGRIDWSRSAVEISRQIRAFMPWPGATTVFRGKELKVLSGWPEELEDFELTSVCSPEREESDLEKRRVLPNRLEPGTIICCDAKKGIFIKCGTGFLKLETVQRPGGKVWTALEFICGAHPRPGEKLGQVVREKNGSR